MLELNKEESSEEECQDMCPNNSKCDSLMLVKLLHLGCSTSFS